MVAEDRRRSGSTLIARLSGPGRALAVLLARPWRSAPPTESRRPRTSATPADRVRDAVLEAIDLPAFVVTAEGLLVHANSEAVGLYGPMVEGTHLSSRIRSPGILDMVREAGLSGEAKAIEHWERVPAERWYQVRVAPMRDVPHEAAAPLLLVTFRDVTEARRMDRMRSDFVANASHELRTPLASLIGFIETLQGPARNDTAARERFLRIMGEEVRRMSRLVDDLLSLSRLELRPHRVPAETHDLPDLIARVCETLQPTAAGLGVTIRFDRPSQAAPVFAERDELIQVFQNLIENACKYGQSGGFVDVAVRLPGEGAGTPVGMVDVAVRDYGPGIARQHVPRLTERFYRVDVQASRSKKGTGLGLAIVKHILTRHRARLIVKSELGKGSLFVARFHATL